VGAVVGAPRNDQAMTDEQRYSLAVADWRRQVHELYRAVRAEAVPEAAHALWVSGRSDLFDRHLASPRREGQSLRHADYDPSFRFILAVLAAEPDRFEVQTGTDGVAPFERVGRFELPFADEAASLDIWWLGSYGGGIFVPLRDGTAGSLTYGAGRYLLDTVKGSDLGRDAEADPSAEWVVDLNFAYNPSCVYDPRWACPLAPAGNRFRTPAPVGELLPAGY
jgi:uncharacterized protein (DUF1684 family)